PIMVAASRPRAADLAGRLGDAMINTEVDDELIARFEAKGGGDRPRYVETTVCWAKDERRARKTAHEVWPLSALGGPLFTELAQPSHFEAAFEPLTEEMVAKTIICGPDPARHVDAIRKAERTGYTHFCVHQVGPEQERFIEFYEREVFPALGGGGASRRKPTVKAAQPARRSPGRARGGQ
ncbi:MAG TPA: LLM class flavin-dependent oxidoreductase, partial [Myxococcota bacterium]|nr:LLM class flavin-dependent oxidoreductase [Myxococcota bacterium]